MGDVAVYNFERAGLDLVEKTDKMQKPASALAYEAIQLQERMINFFKDIEKENFIQPDNNLSENLSVEENGSLHGEAKVKVQ